MILVDCLIVTKNDDAVDGESHFVANEPSTGINVFESKVTQRG